MTARISAWGNSQGFRFPKNIMQELHLQVGDKLKISVENQKIILEPTKLKREVIDLAALVKDIPKDYVVCEEFEDSTGTEEW